MLHANIQITKYKCVFGGYKLIPVDFHLAVALHVVGFIIFIHLIIAAIKYDEGLNGHHDIGLLGVIFIAIIGYPILTIGFYFFVSFFFDAMNST